MPNRQTLTPSISCVVPAYNEARNLVTLVPAVLTALARLSPQAELIIVDDGSRDDTPAVMHALCAQFSQVIYLKLSRNFGKEPALTAGIDAAQGDVVYIDDTHAKVLDINAELLKQVADGNGDRTGVRTTGVMATTDQRKVALFFTGSNHAGENIAEVLARRSQDLDVPILMCDALSSNTSTDFKAIVANCLAHGRRHFVDVVSSFPDEVRHVLDVLGKVYLNDAETRKQAMSAEQRLLFHQQHSGPLMDGLEKWLQQQLDERLVEPSSTLGGAITYMQNHWDKLTLFLRQRGAPLDNNVAERMLKRAILHRKNSLFYKTENGAHVGDVFMSLIHTAELAGANPFDYLVALQRHRNDVTQAPGDWLPWAYQDTLLRLEPPSAPQP